MSFYILSLNARGLRNNINRKALFLFAKQYKTDFLFFQESHSLEKDCNFWKCQWGNDLWLSHCSEYSAGVSTLKNSFGGDILHSECDSNGHFVCLVVKSNNIILIVINIYGFNCKADNDQLHHCLGNKLDIWLFKYPNAYLLVGGGGV